MVRNAVDVFCHCPSCGAALSVIGQNPLRCTTCDLTWFFNPSCAAGAFLFDNQNRVLFIRRANDPRKGTLAVPGGFIDAGESAEDGLRREIREEVGLTVGPLRFLCSHPNRYEYAGITYEVCDFLFSANAQDAHEARSLDGVAGIEWLRLNEVNEDDLAFPSIRAGRAKLLEMM